MLDIKVDFKPIMKIFNQLPQAMQKEMLGKAVSAGASVVKKAALARIPNGGTGNLRKSLVVKKVRAKSPLLSVYTVKFAQGGKHKGYHAHLIEQGHVIWKRAKRGKGSSAGGKRYEMVSTGKRTVARPMLKPAFFTNKDKVIAAVGKRLSADKIERDVLRKLRTRAGVKAGR